MDPMTDNETLLRTVIPSILQNACNVNYKVDITIDNNENIIKINMTAPTRVNDQGPREIVEEVIATTKRKRVPEKKDGEKSNKKWRKYQSIDGFTYERSYKGKKRYICNQCGKGNIDSRYTDTHVCLR